MLVITDTRLNHVARRRYRSSRGMHVYIPRALFCCTSPGPQEIVIKALGNCASCYIVIDRDDSIHTHTHVWRKYRHIHINNKQKLLVLYILYVKQHHHSTASIFPYPASAQMRTRGGDRSATWKFSARAAVWWRSLPLSKMYIYTRQIYLHDVYMPSIKWLAKDARSKEIRRILYIHARMLHVLHHRSHGCT